MLHNAYSHYITCPLLPPCFAHLFFTNWKHQWQRITGVTFHLPHDKSKESWPRKLCKRICCQREKQKCIFGSISDLNLMLIGNLMVLMREKKLLPHWEVWGVQPVACNSSSNGSLLFHYVPLLFPDVFQADLLSTKWPPSCSVVCLFLINDSGNGLNSPNTLHIPWLACFIIKVHKFCRSEVLLMWNCSNRECLACITLHSPVQVVNIYPWYKTVWVNGGKKVVTTLTLIHVIHVKCKFDALRSN